MTSISNPRLKGGTSMNRFRTALNVVIVAALLLSGAIFANTATAKQRTPQTGVTQRTCFPLSIWNASPGLRPCYSVLPPYEDGSGFVWLHTANVHRLTYICNVPDFSEEGNQFNLTCNKVTGFNR